MTFRNKKLMKLGNFLFVLGIVLASILLVVLILGLIIVISSLINQGSTLPDGQNVVSNAVNQIVTVYGLIVAIIGVCGLLISSFYLISGINLKKWAYYEVDKIPSIKKKIYIMAFICLFIALAFIYLTIKNYLFAIGTVFNVILFIILLINARAVSRS